MKKVFIFGTKLRMFLCELPLLFFFVASIIFNDSTDKDVAPVGLYPLIIALGCGMVFMLVYLFRGIVVSGESIRSIGLFSSRDKAIVNKDKTIVLTLRPKHKIKVELFGKDDAPKLDWAINDDTVDRSNVNLYRDIAVGAEGTVKRVLASFDIPKEKAKEIISSERYEGEFSLISVSKSKTEHGDTYSIKLLKTV